MVLVMVKPHLDTMLSCFFQPEGAHRPPGPAAVVTSTAAIGSLTSAASEKALLTPCALLQHRERLNNLLSCQTLSWSLESGSTRASS